MFERLDKEVTMIIDSVIQLSYYMKAACDYDAMMFRTPGERDRMAHFLEKTAEAEAKAVKGKRRVTPT